MKKRICVMVFLMLLGQAMLSPLCVPQAWADARVTVTFAAGGAACGAYFFFHFVLRSSLLTDDYQNDATALFNYAPDGWHIKYPSLNFIENERLTMPGQKDSPGTAQIEIVKFLF
jgi:hypothetical protein